MQARKNGIRRSPQQKFITIFEALKRSLLASIELHRRLTADLRDLEAVIRGGEDIGERAVSPLLSAVSFVDFSHRFGELAAALPTIHKRAAEMRRLEQCLAPVETARNHLQHLRNELSTNDPINYALLGELGWTKDDAAYFVSFTDPHDVSHFSIAFDTEGRWTSTLRYTVKDAWVDLDPILERMRRTYEWVVSQTKFPNTELAKLKWGGTLAVTFRVEIQRASLLNPFMVPRKPLSF